MLLVPEELVVKILSRLPAKSLGKSKCVCTSWLSLISDKHFVQLHLSHASSSHAETNHFRLLLSSHTFYSLDFESPSSFEQHEDGDALANLSPPHDGKYNVDSLLGSCNGIVCLLYSPDVFVFWNPTTGETVQVEGPKLRSSDQDKVVLYGFGYDSSTDDYKLVRIHRSSGNVMCEIFCLKEKTWKTTHEEVVNSYNFTVSDKTGTFVNGFLHWKASSATISKQSVIVSFNVGEEKFGTEILPPAICLTRTIISQSVGVFNGYLSIVSNEINIVNGQTQLVVWIMKEYGVGASWSRLAVIDIFFCDYFNPVWFVKNSELLVDVGGESLIRYNLKKKTATKLKNGCERWFKWAIYVESLVTLH